MKKVCLFVAFVICVSMSLFAQTPLVQGTGAVVPEYNFMYSEQYPVYEDEDQFVNYHLSYGNGKKNEHHSLVYYDKSRKSVYEENLSLPVGFRYIHSHVVGEVVNLYYYLIDNKTQKCTIYSATASLSRSSNGIQELKPEEIFVQNVGKKAEVWSYASQSPDGSKYAFAVALLDGKDVLKGIYIAAYDNSATELWSNIYQPQIKGNSFSIEDMKFSDKGKVVMLLSTATNEKRKVLNPMAQLLSFNENDVISMEMPAEFGTISSMKMMILPNGNYMVGGYYGEKKLLTAGYFTAIFNEREEELEHSTVVPFDVKTKNIGQNDINPNEITECRGLYQLDNEYIALLGEQRQTIMYVDQRTGQKSYSHRLGNILCTLIAKDGENVGTEVIHKRQLLSNGVQMGERNSGERRTAIRILGFNVNAGAGEPVYQYPNGGVSFYPIIKGSDIYFIYTDNIKNFNGKNKKPERLSVNVAQPKQTCVVMAKFANLGDVERKVVMLPTKLKESFNTVWNVDGDRVYFGTFGKNYSIYHFDLDGQWSWD